MQNLSYIRLAYRGALMSRGREGSSAAFSAAHHIDSDDLDIKTFRECFDDLDKLSRSHGVKY